jgi:hypothetical protein
MHKLAWASIAMGLAVGFAIPARAAEPEFQPLHLDAQPQQFESVYAPPEVSPEEKGTNEGGVNLDLRANWMTDYVWRGIDRSESAGSEDSPNLQFEGQIKWDTGKLPHPFIGVFTNIYDSDPASRFQEIRPYFGLELNTRPITFTVGHSNYIFPDRDTFNTAELWGQIKLDDSYFFRSDVGVFNPYVFAAYDYDTNHGLYIELGVSHDFAIEDTPLTLTPRAAIAYVDNNKTYRTEGKPPTDPAFSTGTRGQDSGFQHYEIGVEATYALNQLINLSSRYGKLDLKGFLMYTDGIDNSLRADTEWWGGIGIRFTY